MDNPRVLLAFAVSFLLLLLWQAWMKDYGSQQQAAPPASTAQQVPSPAAPAGTTVPQDLPSAHDETVAPPVAPAAQQLPTGKKVVVHTDLYRAVIDTQGGDLREVDLLKYPVSLKPDSPPFRLMEASGKQLFVAQSGLRAGKGPEPTHHARFQADKLRFDLPADADVIEVPLHWTDGKGIQVTKIYRFHRDSYVIDVEFKVQNGSTQAWKAQPYYQLQRTPLKATSKFIHTYTGGVLYSPADKYQKISFSDMEKKNLDRQTDGGWAAMIQHYFVGAWIPPAKDTERYYTRALPDERYVIGLIGPAVSVAPGAEQNTEARLFVGPKLQNIMRAVAPGLELTVDYGKFTIIAEPIHWLLKKIHTLVGNWGWAIILLTILIKGAFFKLSETSYKSMANMRKLTPRMQALKERYGDDKQKLNQAMMDLYKKEKVNPLGGCLPVLVQIPVFISLYWVLLESVEMRQAPFMLWIHDLSSPDPLYILPVVMGVTMFIQQKLNPAPMDPMQAKVMMVLPLVFSVFFAFFPSGLVLYYVVNNALSIAQQYVITRRVQAASA